MTGIANHAKKSEHEQFGEAVKGVSGSICGLIEAAAQAAYLVGVSDPSSIAGRPGLLDQNQLARASQAIQTACQDLVNPTSNQQQVGIQKIIINGISKSTVHYHCNFINF